MSTHWVSKSITLFIAVLKSVVISERIYCQDGLPLSSLSLTCKLTLLPRLVYASPCWWGSIGEDSRLRLQGVVNRARRWGLCNQSIDINSICCQSDTTLFQAASLNSHHVLHPLLPPIKTHSHDLRLRSHSFKIPIRDKFTKFNFIRRMLFS